MHVWRAGADLSAGLAVADGDSRMRSAASTAPVAVVIAVGGDRGHRDGVAGVAAWRQHRRRDRRGVAGVHAGLPLSVDPADERRARHGGVDDVLPAARSQRRVFRLACGYRVRDRGLDPSEPRAARDRSVVSRASEDRVFDSGRDRRRVSRRHPDALVRIAACDPAMERPRSCLRSRNIAAQCIALLHVADGDGAGRCCSRSSDSSA